MLTEQKKSHLTMSVTESVRTKVTSYLIFYEILSAPKHQFYVTKIFTSSILFGKQILCVIWTFLCIASTSVQCGGYFLFPFISVCSSRCNDSKARECC